MSIEKNINDLFKDEGIDAPDDSPSSPFEEITPVRMTPGGELPRIQLDPITTKPDEPPPSAASGGIEKREFSRIDVLERKIQVRFNTEMQFAKHYIENISLGGMFIRTDEKYQMGDLVPVEFQVPTHDAGEPELFRIKGKVCRVIPTGVGLEFTNLDQVLRARLEGFVQSILPSGIAVRTKAKASTLERLEQMREQRTSAAHRRRQVLAQVLLILILVGLNLYFGIGVMKTEVESVQTRDQSIELGGKKIALNEIRSWKYDSKQGFVIDMNSGETFSVSRDEMPEHLPPELQHTFHLLQSTPPTQPKRRSKTSRHTKLR